MALSSFINSAWWSSSCSDGCTKLCLPRTVLAAAGLEHTQTRARAHTMRAHVCMWVCVCMNSYARKERSVPGCFDCLLPHFPPQAGITTTLNSRCSVLAAANSVFGRWDETKGEDNIDFMPTILSRFDMIFIVKDEHNEERDMVCLSGWAGGSRWFHGHESEQEIFPGKCWCSDRL